MQQKKNKKHFTVIKHMITLISLIAVSTIFKENSKKLSKVFKKLYIKDDPQNDYNNKGTEKYQDEVEIQNDPNLHSEEQDELEIPDDIDKL
ncbi:unnamed protein product [Rhizophagus irregularis]|nr:unnamed protein product [Rhizophagus irregularis]